MTPDVITDTRGQTVNDFVIGFSLFFAVISFTFLFIPSVTAPFTSFSDEGSTIRVERSANHLKYQTFAYESPANSDSQINTECMVAFFEAADVSGCSYDGQSLKETLALRATDNVRVEIRDINGNTPITVDGKTLSRGEEVNPSTEVQVESRIVMVNGEPRKMTVWLW